MSTAAPLQSIVAKSPLVSKSSRAGLLLQRKCACGGSASSSLSGECEECNNKRLQKKLSVGASNDPLEQEADRVADQVLAVPPHSAVSGAPLRIQRYTGQATEGSETALASVDQTLAGPGRPLEPALREDMEQRFGHDFSRVRVHTGGAAGRSARNLNANAYTVGHNVVFGVGRFAPGIQEGRRLIAHELTHVVQQRTTPVLRQLIQRAKIPYGQLTWADFKATPPATTNPSEGAGILSAFDIPGYAVSPDTTRTRKKCKLGKIYKANISVNPAEFDALEAYMDQDRSWALERYTGDGTIYCENQVKRSRRNIFSQCMTDEAAERARLLNHEQGHFKITKIMADKARTSLKTRAETVKLTATECGQEAASDAVLKLYEKPSEDLSKLGKDWQASKDQAQDDYDRQTNHGAKATEQTAWEGRITGGLTDYDPTTLSAAAPSATAKPVETPDPSKSSDTPSRGARRSLATSTKTCSYCRNTQHTDRRLQTKLHANEPGEEFEQEAERVAELTENGNGSLSPSAAAQRRSPVGSLQRLYGGQPVLLQIRQGFGDPLTPAVSLCPSQSRILQRKCACGSAAGMTGECEECSKKLRLGLKTKLKVNEPGDIYEQEADRIANQIMAAPLNSTVSGAPPRIQRFAGQPNGQMDVAPASVGQALACPGRPLEPALRQNMEQRFGHDFSRVRVHSGAAAEQSARDVSAHAYTVGQNIVFGAGRFAPGTSEGRRLIAHELTHVVQQSGADGIRLDQRDGKRDLSPISTTVSTTRRIQRDDDESTDPVSELEQVDDVWHLTLHGFTEAEAVAGYIWPFGTPPGVRVVPLVVVEKPAQIGLFELSGITSAALGTMESEFATWFSNKGLRWTADDLKKMLDTCDGGLGIWAKAKKANKGNPPKVSPAKISPGQFSNTDTLTGEITLDETVDKCQAVQHLIHELSNLSSIADFDKIDVSATAGDLSRDEFIKGIEKIEYEIGVKYVLTAFDACKDKWLCTTSIMEFARKAKDFEDYFKKFVLPAHKEGYGKQWDDTFKKAYDRKHPKK